MAKTKATKTLSVDDWFLRIDSGIEYRKMFGEEERWADAENMFYNRNRQAGSGPGVNVVASNGDSLLSYLSVPNPKMMVHPRRQEFVEAAPNVEVLDNWLMDEMDIGSPVERSILHSFLWGTGVLKIGYDSQYGYDPGLAVTEELTLSMFGEDGRALEYGNTSPGMPWVEDCLPHDIVVPWGTRSFTDAQWVAHRIIRHIRTVQADKKYVNTGGIIPTMDMETYVRSYEARLHGAQGNERRQGTGSNAVEFVEMYEIHDAETGMVFVIARDHGKFLRRQKDLLQIDGLPFVEVSFVPRARSFWVTSDALYLLPAQAELDDITIQGSKQRRIATIKFLYTEGSISQNEMDKMLSVEVGAAVELEAGHKASESITTLNTQAPQTLYQEAEHVMRAAREIVGFSRNQVGEYEASGRRTATEAEIVESGSQRRMSRRTKTLRSVYQRLFRKINQIVFKFWSGKRVLPIIGEEGAREWKHFEMEAIRGEYAYEVTFAAEPFPTQSARRQEAMTLMAQLLQNPYIDPKAMIDYIAKAYNDPDITKLLKGDIQNAGVQLPVSGVQEKNGSVPSQGGGSGLPAELSNLLR